MADAPPVGDLASARHWWRLDPTITFLNHGGYGACPASVLAAQAELRAQLEREPTDFLVRRLPMLLEDARLRVAAFLRADPEGLAFVPNATTGVSTILASLRLAPGDRLVTTDHVYPAVRNAMVRTCAAAGAEMVEVPVPMPPPPAASVVASVLAEVDARTRLVVLDHVASSTAFVFPVDEVVAACHARGVPVLIDAAHAPGMLPVDVDRLGADYWTGNLHKWVCAPKGAAVLWVVPDHRDDVHPLVTSHGSGQGYRAEFDWTGTHDPTPFLAAPVAIDVMGSLGWDQVMRYDHALAAFGRDVVRDALGTDRLLPDDAFGAMSLVELPDGTASTFEATLGVQERLFAVDRIEVPLIWWNDRAFVRMSAQVYNEPEEYERLAAALRRILVT